MSSIEGIGRFAPGDRTPRPRRDGFRVGAETPVAEPVPINASAPVAGLLAIADALADDAAKRHADRLLRALGRWQVALLTGAAESGTEDAAGAARALAVLSDHPPAAHPILRSITDAVALRARIEATRTRP